MWVLPRMFTVCFMAAVASILCPAQADAQPELDITRVVVRDGSLKVDFHTQCNGERVDDLVAEDIVVRYDGDVLPFQGLRCPPTGLRPFSAVLLVDGSAGWSPTDVNMIKSACTVFIDSLVDWVDETSVMMYREAPMIVQQMTMVKPMLYSALDYISSFGRRNTMTALWQTIREANGMAAHNTSAVILLVRDADAGSAVKAEEVLADARQRGVRLYTITIGARDISVEQELARGTGGAAYRVHDLTALVSALLDIQASLRTHAEDCSVVLPLICIDGNEHELHMSVDVCGAWTDDTAVYQAPASGRSTQQLVFELGGGDVFEGDTLYLPLQLVAPPVAGAIYPFTASVQVDTQVLDILDVVSPGGTLFAGASFYWWLSGDVLTIELFEKTYTSTAGICASVVVTPRSVTALKRTELRPVHIHSDCGDLTLHGAHVLLLPSSYADGVAILSTNDRADLMKAEMMVICRKNIVRTLDLYQLSVFVDDLRFPVTSLKSAGEDGRWELEFAYTCRAVAERSLRIEVANACHTTLTGDARFETKALHRAISINGPSYICAGDSTLLSAGRHFDYYRWSTGDTTADIVVYKPDIYIVAVGSMTDGCIQPLPPVIIHGPVQPRIQPPGRHELCPGSSVTLSLPRQYASYRWSTGEMTPTISVSTSGEYFATVVDDDGCIIQSDTVLTEAVSQFRPRITPSDTVTLCQYGGVMLDAGATYIRYEWSNGYPYRRQFITKPGNYNVRVWNAAGCSGVSDMVVVVELPVNRPMLRFDGDTVLCEGDSVALSFDGAAVQQYWSTGDTTIGIVISGPGSYWVDVWDENGCVTRSDTLVLETRPRPGTPAISRYMNTLSTYPAARYQWYFEGMAIPGAERFSYTVTQTGRYQVSVANAEGCWAMSEPFTVSLLSTEVLPPSTLNVDLYPEPTTGIVQLVLSSPTAGTVEIAVTDLRGRLLRRIEAVPVSTHSLSLDLRDMPSGLYLLRISLGDEVILRTISKL